MRPNPGGTASELHAAPTSHHSAASAPSTLQRQPLEAPCRVSPQHPAASAPSTLPRQPPCRVSPPAASAPCSVSPSKHPAVSAGILSPFIRRVLTRNRGGRHDENVRGGRTGGGGVRQR